jgi:hypothetical protein
MSWADSFLIVLTLLTLINVCLLISLRRRTSRVESQTAYLRARCKQLERDVDTVTDWVSPNHQVSPIDLKSLDIRR